MPRKGVLIPYGLPYQTVVTKRSSLTIEIEPCLSNRCCEEPSPSLSQGPSMVCIPRNFLADETRRLAFYHPTDA